MKLWNLQKLLYEKAVIESISIKDFSIIKKNNQFQFNWSKEKDNHIFKVRKIDDDEILGLISIIDFPKESRLEIHLLELSKENIGKKKKMDRIAGCLIAYVCDLSFQKNYGGFVSLISKTEIIDLYKKKYGFEEQGNHLYTHLDNSESLIKKYLA